MALKLLARPWVSTALWWAAGVMALGLAASMVASFHWHAKAKGLGEQVEQLQGEVKDLKERVRERDAAIREYQIANTELTEAVDQIAGMYDTVVRQNVAIEQDLAEVRRALARQRAATAMALDNLKKARETTYALHHDCRAWADAPLCGPVSDQLRQSLAPRPGGGAAAEADHDPGASVGRRR
jgi:DNA repair exonuclease SbcCD ATPase subunit